MHYSVIYHAKTNGRAKKGVQLLVNLLRQYLEHDQRQKMKELRSHLCDLGLK